MHSPRAPINALPLVPVLLAALLTGCDRQPQSASVALPETTAPAAAPSTPAASATQPPDPRLASHHWRLIEARDAHGDALDALFVASTPALQLDFDADRLVLSNACNRIVGSYALDGAELRVGRMASTRMACPDPARVPQERAAGNLLSGSFKLSIGGDDQGSATLALLRSDGTRLAFRGDPTEAGREGVTETVFLEVAAASQPCPATEASPQRCLWVRELAAAPGGPESEPAGSWSFLATPIEGYTHEEGVRDVLRLSRYRGADSGDGTARPVLVLDALLESAPAGPATAGP